MNITLVLSIIGGCHVQQVQQVVAAPVVAQQVAYVPALYQTYGVVDPYWVPRDDTNEQIQQLTKIVAQLTAQIDAKPKENVTARQIFDRSCISCHNAEKTSGDLDLTDPGSYRLKLKEIGEQVSLGRMPPPPATELSDVEETEIKAWVNDETGAVRALLRSK